MDLPSNKIGGEISNLRAQVGRLATRAVRGDDLNTSAISDASDALNVAMDHYRNGDYEDAREAIVLARELLDAAVATAA